MLQILSQNLKNARGVIVVYFMKIIMDISVSFGEKVVFQVESQL